MEDAIGLVCENRWLQCFGLGGNLVVCLCVESGAVLLRGVVHHTSDPNSRQSSHLVQQLAKACADAGLSFRVEL